MSFISLLRSAPLRALVSSLFPCVAPKDFRAAPVSKKTATGTTEMQYYVLFRRLVNPAPPQNRPSSESQDQSNQPGRPRPDYRAIFLRRADLTIPKGRGSVKFAEN